MVFAYGQSAKRVSQLHPAADKVGMKGQLKHLATQAAEILGFGGRSLEKLSSVIRF